MRAGGGGLPTGRGHRPLHSVQAAVAGIIAPLQGPGEAASGAVDDLGQAQADASASEETLSALKQQNAELRNLLAQAEEYRLKAQDLENLLNLKDIYEIEGMGAHVIGRSTDSWNQTITLDIGESSGVKPGLTVMGSYGVVGQVASVADRSCTVRLLTDPQSALQPLSSPTAPKASCAARWTASFTLKTLRPMLRLSQAMWCLPAVWAARISGACSSARW